MSSISDFIEVYTMPSTKFKPDNQVAYDRVPVQFKVLPGVREQLKKIPNWQNQLREYVDLLIFLQNEPGATPPKQKT